MLDQLERGFDDTGACSGGNEAFRLVIDEGEDLLSRLADPGDRARVHFLVAAAYADIVGLADGADRHIIGRRAEYAEEAEDARGRAIELVGDSSRIGRAGSPSSPSARPGG